ACAELTLELRQRHAGRRLGQAQHAGSRSHSTALHHGNEDLELPECRMQHHPSPALIIRISIICFLYMPPLHKLMPMNTEADTIARQPPAAAGLALGLALVGIIAALALWAAELPALRAAGLSALTLAILLGLALGNTIFPRLAV